MLCCAAPSDDSDEGDEDESDDEGEEEDESEEGEDDSSDEEEMPQQPAATVSRPVIASLFHRVSLLPLISICACCNSLHVKRSVPLIPQL